VKRSSTSGLAAAILSIVVILIVPLPTWLLDILLALNIFGCALVLLMSVTIADPLEFAAFAPALLIATLFRLSLDVSATRLILTQGHIPGGAGSIIPAFGDFVVRGNVVVGLIIFAILVTIQFVVIAQGSQRVAEVAARFTLDAMPGKQMAIDADVHAGTIDSEGARSKRKAVQKEADFYGAMDGAGKYVKGDAVAALVIVILNLIGGVAVGVFYHGMSATDAIATFALLSIGNALVTTLPAFLMSIAMGMMVTRVAAEGSLGFDLATQVFSRPDILRSAGTLVLLLSFVPALPRPVFLVLGILAFVAAQFAARGAAQNRARERAAYEESRRLAIRRPEMALGFVGVDAIAIEFGAELAALLAEPVCEQLLDRIGEVRRGLASEIGIVIPGVRLRDDLARDEQSYAIRIHDQIMGEARLFPECLLAVAEEAKLEHLVGRRVAEPVYGLPAKWIATDARDAAQQAGALVFDAISILGSHLAEVARANAAELLGRQELQTLIEHLRGSVPAVVKEIGTEAFSLSVLHKAFCLLLRERAWPRDPVSVLEAMVDVAPAARDPRTLAEAARRIVIPQLLRARGVRELEPLVFAPEMEARLLESWVAGDEPVEADPALALRLRERIGAYAAATPPPQAAVVCTSALRPLLADFLLRSALCVDIFAYGELPPEVSLRPAGIIAQESEVRLAS